MTEQEEIIDIVEPEQQDVEQHVGEIRPDDSGYLAFLVEQGDSTSKQKVKQALQEEAILNWFSAAEELYSKIMMKVLSDSYESIVNWRELKLTKAYDFLIKLMKELAATMDWTEQSKEVRIESNIRKLNRSELLSR